MTSGKLYTQEEVNVLIEALSFYAKGDYTIYRGEYWNHWTNPPTLEYPLMPKHIGRTIEDAGKLAIKSLKQFQGGIKK